MKRTILTTIRWIVPLLVLFATFQSWSSATAQDQDVVKDAKAASHNKTNWAVGSPFIQDNAQASALRGGLIWDNGPLSTGDVAVGDGAMAPLGTTWSELQAGNGFFGFGHQVAAGNRIADDFELTLPTTINTVTFYAYQTGSSTTSTINDVRLQIWDSGGPGTGTVVFGDTVTNYLTTTIFSDIYRTSGAPSDTARPIMAQTLDLSSFGVALAPGTYWLDWSVGGTLASGPWAPAVTIVGMPGKPGANAQQSIAGGPFAPAVDGVPQDFPFLITGVEGDAAFVTSGPVAIESEDCTPENGLPDPGETLTVSLPLENVGNIATTDVTATLEATGGVTNPSGPVNYGAIAPGGSATNNFTFTVDPKLPCGDDVTLTWTIVDGAESYPDATTTYGTGIRTETAAENMDGVTAPALPAGWTNTQTVGTEINWITTETDPFSAPNAAFANEPGAVNASALSTPAILIDSPDAQLSFANNYQTESTFDGGVLEVSTDGGTTWMDIIDAGGSFVSGGYNSTISTGFDSPIGGRMAWSGNSGGYIDTVVSLPASFDGQSVAFRWLMATDSSVTATGWWIDDFAILGANECAECTGVQTVFPDSVETTRGTYVSGNVDDLATSNNSDYVIQRNGTDTLARTELTVVGSSATLSPSSLEVMLEGAVFARSQVIQSIALWNYVTGEYEEIDARPATNMVDSVVTVPASGDLSRFVDQSTSAVQARVRFQSGSPRQRFSSNTDKFNWMIGQ